MEQQQSTKKRFKRKRSCPLKSKQIEFLDYKDIESFSRYITDRGKIAPMRNTNVSACFQRYIATAIKRARVMCLIPHTAE
eukprot:COSAG01_NODE_1433_length_10317_cov_590.337366_2_plen_80_part_00